MSFEIVSKHLVGCGFLLVSLFFNSTYLWAEDSEVTLIKISGNTKTRSSYIEDEFLRCQELYRKEKGPGDELKYLKQCLYNLRFFSEVEVSRDKNEYKIRVVDKWTIIPIPIIDVGGKAERSYGAFVFDSNFLGFGVFLAVGTIISNVGNQYVLIYKNETVRGTPWYFMLVGEQSRLDLMLYEGREETDGFKELRRKVRVDVGYEWTFLVPKIIFQREDLKFSKLESYETPKDNNRAGRIGLGLEYDRTNYKFFFVEGVKLEITGNRDLTRTDGSELRTDWEVQANYGIALWKKHGLLLQYWAGGLENGEKFDAFRLGRKIGFRGIGDKNIWAGRFYATSADYQIPVRQLSFGTWTVAPFIDTGRVDYRGGDGSHVSYTAYGIGTYIFLKKIALPGVGLQYGSNNAFQKSFVFFTLGLRM